MEDEIKKIEKEISKEINTKEGKEILKKYKDMPTEKFNDMVYVMNLIYMLKNDETQYVKNEELINVWINL